MKSLTLMAVLLLIATQSFSQLNTQSQERLTYYNKVERYRKMKSTGTFLTITGSILSVVGIVTLANSSIETVDYGNGNTTTTKNGHPITGLLMTVTGHAALGTGIPLMIIGGNNHKKYQKKLDALTVSFKSNTSATGFTLAYHF